MGQNHPQKKFPKMMTRRRTPKAGSNPLDNPFSREQGNESDERVEAQEEVDRDLQIEGERGMENEVDQDKNRKRRPGRPFSKTGSFSSCGRDLLRLDF